MEPLRLLRDRWLWAVAITATTGIAGAALTLQPALQARPVPGGTSGHPAAFERLPIAGHPQAADMEELLAQGAALAESFMAQLQGAPGELEIPADLLAPLAQGEYVNFESPNIHPIAVSSDGNTVFAVNTPNNSLVVLSTAGGLHKLDEIFVGLDPVSLEIQPGTEDAIVWVANHISDTVAVVDTQAGKVMDVINVGDEPVYILFDPTGAFAFVVIQGSPYTPDNAAPTNSPFVELGHLVTIDTATRQVVSNTYLDCNTPRAAVYDAATQQIVVAAHHSGNNTTLAGTPVELHYATPTPTDPPPLVGIPSGARGCLAPNPCTDSNGCVCRMIPSLWVAQQFSATAGIFDPTPGEMSELSPWPDDAGSNAAPLVPRIVRDNAGDWYEITRSILTDEAGLPKSDMVALMNSELGIINAAEVITHMYQDAKDTVDHDLIVLDASAPGASAGVGLPITRFIGNVGTTLNGIAQNPVTRDLFVANLQANNTVRQAVNLNGRFLDHVIEIVADYDQPAPIIMHADLHYGIPNFDDVSGPNPNAWQKSLAHPHAIAFHGNGLWAVVTSLGMDRIGIVNGLTGRVLGRLDVPPGPRGLAVDSVANRVYVLSRHAMTVTAVDVSAPSAPQIIDRLALFNPEPRRIREGRRFHYSAKFSHNGGHSCDSCHPDTDFDRLAWDLGSNGIAHQPGPPNLPEAVNHPLKGPMVTQSLRGLDRHEPLHWRGDKPVFQDFNEAFRNLLGGEELAAEEMDAFNGFIKSVLYRPNPYFKRTNAFKEPRAVNGLVTYLTFCNACHQMIPDLGNPLGHDGAAFTTNGDAGISAAAFFGQFQLVTQMRGLHKKFIGDYYNGFGMIHDGREERESNAHPLQTFLNEFFPETLTGITLEDQLDMIAAMNAFPSNVMNVVGWEVVVKTPVLAPALSNLDVMVAQYLKVPSHCDIIAKASIGGVQRGYWLIEAEAGVRTFLSDQGEQISQDELLALLQPDDVLIFTAVPPGSGKRIGIDQDTDGIPDGLDPMPQHDNTGDFDLDGDVDLLDAAALQACFSSPSGFSVPADCALGDANEDGNVDLADYRQVQALHSGPVP